MEVKTPLVGQVFGKMYKIVKKLGSGAFGDIYLCVNIKNMEEYAIKLEKSDNPHPQVFFEAKLYQYLQSDSLVDKGIPRLHFSGTDNGYNIIVMDLLGQSLEDLFQKYKRKFSLKCVLQLGLQMIARIEFLHSKSFIHRDIKPDNFVMGIGKKQHQVYMIDFGLSKRYISRDKGHIPYKDGKSLTGTARYASINTHLGIEQSRRDDLESIGYVLLYFLKGQLPWQNMKANNKKDKYRQIMEKKMQTPVDQLIKGFPRQFGSYLNYCKNLRFEEKPDYAYLQSLFKDMMKENQLEFDFVYDWTSPLQPKPAAGLVLSSNAQIPDMIPNRGNMASQQQQQQQHDLPTQILETNNLGGDELALQQQQINKIRNTSMNNINMRTTMQSSNKFSSNRKSIENQLQVTQQIVNHNNSSQYNNDHVKSKQTPNNGYNLAGGNIDSKDTYLIEEEMKGSLLLRTQGISSGYQNQRIMQMNNDINSNIYQLPSATKNQPVTNYSQNNSIMNSNTKNPTLSRLQKQNQKLSELLKTQQQQTNVNSVPGANLNPISNKTLAGGVPLPKIVNHRAQVYNQFRN